MTSSQSPLQNPPRWATQRRLEFIEAALYWLGRVNRSQLVDRFGISVPQASADLQAYLQSAGNGVRYDLSEKAYVVTEQFAPTISKPSADQYLRGLLASRGKELSIDEVVAYPMPAFDVLPSPRRPVGDDTLRQLVQAILYRRTLRIRYQSMSRDRPSWRQISPHALAFDRFRWHARCFCHEDRRFKDFVVARVLELGEHQRSEIDAECDLEWTTWLTVRIAPHPELSVAQRNAIELDYGMTDGVASIEVRAAMLFYLKQQLRWNQGTQSTPGEQQIIVVNADEVESVSRDIRTKAATILQQVPDEQQSQT